MPTKTAAPRVRVRVDPIRCTAFGFCAEFCPEMFTLDEWGYAWLNQSDASPKMLETIQETARLCPRRAILVDEIAAGPATRKPDRKSDQLTLRKI